VHQLQCSVEIAQTIGHESIANFLE